MLDRHMGRHAAGAGILFVGLMVARTLLYGSTPKTGDPAATVAAFFVDHRTRILIAAYLTGLALCAFLAFLCTVAGHLRDGGQLRLGALALGAGLVAAAMAMVGMGIDLALAYGLAGSVSPGLVRGLWLISTLMPLAFPLAVLVGATSLGLARMRAFPEGLPLLGGLATIAFLAGGATYARDGWFSPTGAYGLAMLIVFLVWTVVMSTHLVLRRDPAEEPSHASHAVPSH